jgi:hypothetical protein
VAKYIYETGTQHGKKVQAAGGAKNYVFVLPDADFGNSVTGWSMRGVWLRRTAVHGRIDGGDDRGRARSPWSNRWRRR